MEHSLMNTLNKINIWVANNPLKYHLYTKSPLIVLVCFVMYIT